MSLLSTVLDAETQRLLRREAELLVKLREVLESEQVDERRRVDDLLAGLEDLFTVVIVGEFNAGKSSFINALFGEKLRTEGPIPVDDRISVLRFGAEASTRPLSEFVLEQTYPIEFLKTITLVDTPGTNSIVARHQEITQDYIPRADLVLFVTSIDRPLSESERKFLEYIREWGRKVVFVLNKIDTKSDEEIEQVSAYLQENIRSLFGFDPTIYPVSSKLAFDSKKALVEPRQWTRSRFEALEDYMFKVLSEKERVRLKLQAPLDAISSIAKKQVVLVDARRQVLSADKQKIDEITSQLAQAREDLRKNVEQFAIRVDNLLLELERRGLDFLERTIRIGNILILRDAARFREAFERQVFLDWQGSVDRTVQESVDWLVKENMKLWRDTVEEFHRSAEMRAETLIGKVGREFAYNRDEVYARIRGEAERRLNSYNVEIESRRMIDSAMSGVLQSFGLGVTAIGLGYGITTIFSSMAIDVTGLTAATMLLVTSFFILPYKRSKAKTEFEERIGTLRAQMRTGLERESSAEIDRMIGHIASAFEPYERFFTTESSKIERYATKLAEVEQGAREISAAVASLR